MARKVGQIVRRGARAWLVRVYNGRDPESKKRKYLNRTIHGDFGTVNLISTKCWVNEIAAGIWIFVEANTESIPGSLARSLRQAEVARQEL